MFLAPVSPLAEGTDRIFADQAIDLGYELLCPMPFVQEEFEKDFLPPEALEPDSRERFRGLLKRAREGAGVTTFELDGNRSAAPNAYALGGRVVLNQSDLLVVVWDGQNRAGDGSTVDTAQEAIGLPACPCCGSTRWRHGIGSCCAMQRICGVLKAMIAVCREITVPAIRRRHGNP